MNESIPKARSYGKRLPRFTGNSQISIFNTRDIDAVILDRLDALSNIEIVFGPKLDAIISDKKLTITIPKISAGGGLKFKGEYDPTKTYAVDDFFIISAGSNAGTFITVQTAPPGSTPPTNPTAGNEFFICLPGSQLGQWM